ncbi:MAG: hypothetical protein HY077_12810 [Elusimicrobia bacterium]|nr:hypothetical protein [Elusimicrobiota bacterium]
MPRWIFLLALVPLSGFACAEPKTRVEYAENMDLARYKRIAVLPFTDKKGRGRLIALAITKGLPPRGFEAADASRLEEVFARFKPDSEMGLGITELTEVKQATQAQAILTGAVDASGLSASVLLLDTELGDEIFKGTLVAPNKKPFQSVSDVAAEALSLFAELPSRQK